MIKLVYNIPRGSLMNHTLSLIIYINVAYHFTQAPCNTMCTDVNCWLFLQVSLIVFTKNVVIRLAHSLTQRLQTSRVSFHFFDDCKRVPRFQGNIQALEMEDAENAGAYASRDFHVSTLNFHSPRKKPDEQRYF